MIYIFTALYPEARPIIQYFKLIKDTENTRFQVFCNEENGICLTITGTGSIAAATAVASICTEYGIKAHDFLINIGTCAGRNVGIHPAVSEKNDKRDKEVLGKILLCNKITEQATGKTFYPDILYCHSFDEAGIITGSRLLDNKNGNANGVWAKTADFSRDINQQEIVLYDMEAAAIYQAGAYFFGPHQMSFLKIVSDAGAASTVSVHSVEQMMAIHVEGIAAYIRQLCNIAKTEQYEEKILSDRAAAWIDRLSADLHCSKVMQDSLRQHIRYLELAGSQYEDILGEMYAEGKLPCKDKREGKVRFEELKRKLL